MKKVVSSIIITLFAVVMTGCGKAEEKTLTCTLHKKDVINGYEINSTYKAQAKDNVVTKVETQEIVTTDTPEMANYFEETLQNTYQKMHQSYGGYEFTVTNKDNKVTSDVTIDYTKLNLEQLAKDDSAIKGILDDKNRMTLDGMKALYEAQGATCE